MVSRSVGRPRAFDRDDALGKAAFLFWRHGYSGTSTRMLTGALGISSSSLYAAFGTKAELFDEAVRTYASRYSAIYERAVAEPSLTGVIERVLIDSIAEFTSADDGHPGCLTSSAAMADTSATLDVRSYVASLRRSDEARLRERLDRETGDGAALTAFVQTVWQGLSARSELGATRAELTEVAALALDLIAAGHRVRPGGRGSVSTRAGLAS
ncbi:TetR/AcrR family transcriptional regulator [Actinoplanes sp. G11-F43]|uniref:TetR/AcrR family transcriptional regulator n=1 Tax=Actinoplanes sp. G11-F43 TaxID=3424130 RepID=UPI003D352D12